MKLGEKLRYLREVEGSLRGMGRALTQQELVQAIRAESKTSLSQSYLSQIEGGTRPHLTNTTRQILAKFFKVHPGYLVDDPDGYHAELMSEVRVHDEKLDLWLVNGAERFPRDCALKKALLTLAKHPDSRQCLLLLEQLIETPGLMERLNDALRPAQEQSAPVSKPVINSGKGRRERREPAMTWEMFYLGCFVFGLVLSGLAFLGGGHHHLHFHQGPHHHGAGTSLLNGFSLTAFLCWFGGAGYLLERYGRLGVPLILTVAGCSGMLAAFLVFWFLAKVLAPHDRPLTAADTEMSGVLGRVSGTIRPEGTGEILFSQYGARCSAAARSETGQLLERGKEVVVLRYERGIAYVRPWEEGAQAFPADITPELSDR